MTGDLNAHAEPSRSTAIEAAAAHWLQRRRFWNWSEDDQRQLDEWLSLSGSHRVAYWRLKAGFERSNRLSALQSPGEFGRPAPAERERLWPLLRRTAAGLAVVAACGIASVQFFPKHEGKIYETDVGGRQTIVLTDGSKIDLNTGTLVRVKGRSAELLRGEAFFQITHDAARPFVVTAGSHRITDLGTKFAVRAAGESLEVSLVQGRARIDVPGAPSQKAAVLEPGDVAVATANRISVNRKSQQDLVGALGWRRGVLVFHQTTLADAAAEFNRYNSKKLVVSDPQAARLTIGATFPTDDIESFARTAKNVFGLRVEDRGSEIVISH
jgi:transmembrane sensor